MTTTPKSLTGAATTFTVDGVDMHTYGLIAKTVKNPLPDARESTTEIAGRDGAFDFTGSYEPRDSMVISGSIIADSESQLLSNIDFINSYFRLKTNKDTFKIVFQNQTDRYWTCRYKNLEIGSLTNWFGGHIASYTLKLVCVKPYAEAVSMTTEEILLHCCKNKQITYAGSLRAPLNMEMSSRLLPNILDYHDRGFSGDYTKWDYINATGSNDSTQNIYGSNCVKVTRTSSGSFTLYKNLTSMMATGFYVNIDTTKNYVLGAYCYVAAGTSHTKLSVLVNSVEVATSNFYYASVVGGYSSSWAFVFVKLTPAMLAGATSIFLEIINDGAQSEFYVDGCFLYYMTTAEAADTNYSPPPYSGVETVGDFGCPSPLNPIIRLFASKNIFPLENGDFTVADWSGDTTYINTTDDPFGNSDRCFAISENDDTEKTIYTPKFLMSGSKYYRISYDYYVKKTYSDGYAYIRLASRIGNGIALGDMPIQTILIPEESGIGWVTIQHEFQLFSAAEYGYLKIEIENCTVYLKNIMIVEAEKSGDAFDAYQKPNIKKIAYTGSLYNSNLKNDKLILNSDIILAEKYNHNHVPPVILNAMETTIFEPLILESGTNLLRYQDARLQSASPEFESCGFVQCKINYRARYL